MKTNKIKQLSDLGLSKILLNKLTEGQIKQLHVRMVSEVTMVSQSDTQTMDKLKNEKKPFEVYEKEIDEDDTLDVVNDPDASADGMGMFETEIGEGKKKKSKYNPYAICTSSVGRDDKDKYEKCVMDVKKNIREGKNPHQVIVEMALEKLVEKHISPKMTKSELLTTLSESGVIKRQFSKMDKPVGKLYTSNVKESNNELEEKWSKKYKDSIDCKNPKGFSQKAHCQGKKSSVKEQGTKTAPAPTRVAPGTKEREKPKTVDPFKQPKHQPKPKAEFREQGTKTAPAPTRVAPGTKEREKPKTVDPFKQPKHQPKPKAAAKDLTAPAPKMGTTKIPDYLTFDQLNINFKDQ